MNTFDRLLKNVNAMAIDLDGVVYAGDNLLPYAKEFIAFSRNIGKSIFFITNNSGKSRKNITKKLKNLGIDANIDEVYSSGYATGLFLKQLDIKKDVYVIGSDELKEELTGLQIDLSEKPDCKYLVVGFDKDFTYEKIAISFQMIQEGAIFIACNRDKSYPINDGKSMPACNAMIAAIEYTTGKKPDYVIGKPETFMLEIISKKYNFQPNEIIVIGDSPETDIVMANKFGSPSVLVSKNFIKKQLKGTNKPSLLIKSLKIDI
ncbi:MAG TPA: HAD-IIA family hydrolase [Syntrophorhabdaceae bacterium]|nr:HAD-IIA family hydrolase [Syntrophorhabdaceae bacterium]